MVYAINSRNSFDEIINFREQISAVKDDTDVPMVLVGNKCDLESDREVSTEEGKNLAKSFNAPFFETSAATQVNVEKAFHELVREYVKRQNVAPKAEKKKSGGCVLL